MARPTLYRSEYPEQAEKLCKLGAVDAELADFFGVSEVTINAWKKEFPRFLKSIKRGKLAADAEVAQKLFHRAIGYEHPDTHFSAYEGDVTETPTIKHYPPDPVAAIFWLKNRQPDKWRDRKETEITIKRTVGDLSDDDLNRIASRGGAGTSEAKSSTPEPSQLH